MVMRARAPKMLPMLMPALAAGLRGRGGGGVDGEGDADGEVSGVSGEGDVDDEDNGVGGDEVLDGEEEGGDDTVGAAFASTVEEAPIVDNADAVVLEPPPSEANALRPHVCGWTASFDVMLKAGVLEKSSPAKFSTCMWQTPVFSYSL